MQAKKEVIKLEWSLPPIDPVLAKDITDEQARDFYYLSLDGTRAGWEDVYSKHPEMLADLKEQAAAKATGDRKLEAGLNAAVKHGAVKVRTCFGCSASFEHFANTEAPPCPRCATINEKYASDERQTAGDRNMGIRFDATPAATDIFASGAAVLLNPVNCVGTMGNGLAEQFKKRFPEIMGPYKVACDSKTLRPGKLLDTRFDPETRKLDPDGSLVILNFPTKDDWREDSRIEWIESGMKALAAWIDANKPASIAIPQLGTGKGKLSWDDVAAVIKKELAGVEGVDIHILGQDPQNAVSVAEFQGANRIGSNMYRADVYWGDEVTPHRLYPCNELPYQLAKTDDPEVRKEIIRVYREAEQEKKGGGPYAVKKFAANPANVPLRADWNSGRKDRVMLDLVRDKTARNPVVRQWLRGTGKGIIEEGNKWGDVYWGKSLIDVPKKGIKAGDGLNKLGKIHMQVRDEDERGLLPDAKPVARPAARASQPAEIQPSAKPVVVNLKSFGRERPASVLDCSRYGESVFRDGTKLGNDHVMSEYGGKGGSREDVIRLHARDFLKHLGKPGFTDWLMKETAGKQLGCFCAPKACHCDTIAAAVEAISQKRDPRAAMGPFLTSGMKTFAGIGSRETPIDVCHFLKDASAALAERGWVLRSGRAKRADIACEMGCDSVNGMKRIFIPSAGFKTESDSFHEGFAPKNLPWQLHVGVDQAAIGLAKSIHPKPEALSDYALKLQARNGYQMFDVALDRPVSAVLCWTENGLQRGGTAQALRMAERFGIEVVNKGAPEWRNASIASVINAMEEMHERKLERLAKDPVPFCPATVKELPAAKSSTLSQTAPAAKIAVKATAEDEMIL